MGLPIALTDEQWRRVADLFDPRGRRGAPARIPRRQMVNAMLFLARIDQRQEPADSARSATSRSDGPTNASD